LHLRVTFTQHDKTALMLAAFKGHKEVVKSLLDGNATIELWDKVREYGLRVHRLKGERYLDREASGLIVGA
jgi:hypothetical protein